MKRLLAALAALPLLLAGAPAAPQAPGTARFEWFDYQGSWPVYRTVRAGPGEYLNPILEGFYPDPSIVRAGRDFYLVNSTFAYFPGIPVFHSRDLVHWTQIGNAIDRPSQLKFDGLNISRGVFAPDIKFHDGVFYIINTCVDCGGNFVLTARNPAGPWSDPVWLPFDGIDPSLFFDTDGKAYLVNNGPPPGAPLYEGHRAIWIQEFDLKQLKLVGPRTMLVNGGTDISQHPAWIEGPHVFRREDFYYLIAAEGGTGDRHSEVVFRSASIRGPFVPYAGNPILTQRDLDPNRANPITSTGHADFVTTPEGDWWAVFLGTRPYQGDFYNTGRETFLARVRWMDGWPQITARGEGAPYVANKPALPSQPVPKLPTSGDFSVHEDFRSPALAAYWSFIHVPQARWWSVGKGGLTLRARPESIGGLGQPSFVGRRQQHMDATVSTAVRFTPEKPGDRAGLVAIQDNAHFYFVGVELADGRPVVRVRRRAGPQESADGEILAAAPLDGRARGPVYLRIEARGGTYGFVYAERPGAWKVLLDNADGTLLSTKTAGGFVGTMLGMYAYSPPSR